MRGLRVCVAGGMHGVRVCVMPQHMAGGVHCRGGHAWQGSLHGRGYVWWGACMVGGRGMHGGGVHVWQGWVHVWQERQPLQRTIRMLLDCILANIAYIILVCIPMCHTMNVNKKYENFSIKGRFL